MAKSPLIVIYPIISHLCFARFQLLGAVRRPVLISSQKGRHDALIFQGFHAWWFHRKLIIKTNVFWNDVLHVEFSFCFLSFPFSPYILSRQRQEIQKQTLDFGDIFTKLQTSSAPQMTDSQVTSTAARQRKWCLDPCRMLPGRADLLNPLVRLEVQGVQGVNRPKHPKNPWSGAFCASQLGSWKPFFLVETYCKCEMGWQGFFFLEPNQKRSKFR